jgi:hypothetical protein
MDSHLGQPGYDSQSLNKRWKSLKAKKKAKWIKKARVNISEYIEKVDFYCAQNPGIFITAK